MYRNLDKLLSWDEVRVVANIVTILLLMCTLARSVGQTSGRCIKQLAKMSTDHEFIEHTAGVLRRNL